MGYCLSLSDGNNWWITANKSNAQFISKLANIMSLKECKANGFCKLIIRERESEYSNSSVVNIDSITSTDQPKWKVYESPSIRIRYNDADAKVICEIKNEPDEAIKYINMWFSLQPIYRRSISLGGLPFHSGLAELNGKGVLFSASGNTGKSTCCRRLPSYWKPLCDDEVLVVLNKSGEYMAHPFPTWSDYLMQRAENTWDVQYSVPLSAIFFIEQSEIDEVIPIRMGESAIKITGSADQVCQKFLRDVSQEEKLEFKRNLFSNAYDMAKKIPAFQLRVSLNGNFWEKIEKVIK
jgi:SynChlorMet cassette protein ScmC